MNGKSYKDLKVWSKSMDLVTEIYKVTGKFPKEEIYGLTNQLRRAAVSVPSNIAEGQGRFSRKEFQQFLHHARGSLLEVETQIQIAMNLQYLTEPETKSILNISAEIGRMINGLKNSLS